PAYQRKRGEWTSSGIKSEPRRTLPPAEGGHARRENHGRRAALPGRPGWGGARRAHHPAPAGSVRPPAAPPLRRAAVPQLRAADAAAPQPPDGRAARRRRGAAAEGAARGPPAYRPPVPGPCRPAHALGAE